MSIGASKPYDGPPPLASDLAAVDDSPVRAFDKGAEELMIAEIEAAKRDGNKPLSQALKIIMNAFYGVLGSSGCRFFDPRLASSITMRGHEIMRQTRQLIEARGYEVIYGDTDSTFVWLRRARTEDDAGQIGRSLVAYVNDWWRDHLWQTYGLESALELQFETHFRRFLMPTIRGTDLGSKKRYAGQVMRPDGTAFDGLYAAGEVAGFGGGGMMGYNALEGTFLGGCLFSGRTAGRAAARAVG